MVILNSYVKLPEGRYWVYHLKKLLAAAPGHGWFICQGLHVEPQPQGTSGDWNSANSNMWQATLQPTKTQHLPGKRPLDLFIGDFSLNWLCESLGVGIPKEKSSAGRIREATPHWHPRLFVGPVFLLWLHIIRCPFHDAARVVPHTVPRLWWEPEGLEGFREGSAKVCG